jgi:hypothetical protein
VPESVPPGVEVRFGFLVRPDGTVDTASGVISGTDDARFKRDAVKFASQLTFTPAVVDGCPVWSHEAIVSVRGPIVRENPNGPGKPRTF